jgi:shikimate dehydrogenase
MQAKALGLKYTDGLNMLVAQAIKSQEIWLDKKIDDSAIESVYLWLKKAKQNVVLIGMPSSGKTTIGKRLSTLLGKEFVDTDEIIKERTSLFPSEIISGQGEEEFRKIESQILLDVLKNCNQVVATGGGAILLEQNRFAIKHNGTAIYVKRDLDKLSLSNRPLSKSKGIEKLFNERKSIYESLADITVENNLDIDSVIKEITEKL